LDFGDAPDPGYPSLLINDGPRHRIPAGEVGYSLFLGGGMDFEPDSKQVDADSDDGVVFLGSGDPGGPYALPYVAGSEGAVSVTVGAFPPGMPGPLGTVCAWFDWNQDAAWTSAEQAFCASLAEGTHLLAFNVPSSVVGGTTWARFRLAPQDTAPTGLVDHGEVEDYEVEVEAPPPVGGITEPLDVRRVVTLALAILGGLLLAGAAIVVWRRRTSSV
jgi:hypothetical protein